MPEVTDHPERSRLELALGTVELRRLHPAVYREVPGNARLQVLTDREHVASGGLQVAQLDVPLVQLVANDHREVCAVAGGRLQLLPQLARAQLRPRGKPGRTQLGRNS